MTTENKMPIWQAATESYPAQISWMCRIGLGDYLRAKALASTMGEADLSRIFLRMLDTLEEKIKTEKPQRYDLMMDDIMTNPNFMVSCMPSQMRQKGVHDETFELAKTIQLMSL